MHPAPDALLPSVCAREMLVYLRFCIPVVSVNVWLSAKCLRSTVAAAPFWLGCPAGYSGCAGVTMSGSQPGSDAVSGLPSASASGIAVTGRQVTSLGWEP